MTRPSGALVTRTAHALSAWLSPAWNENLDLRPDLDAIEPDRPSAARA